MLLSASTLGIGVTARLQLLTDRYGSTDGQFAWAVS